MLKHFRLTQLKDQLERSIVENKKTIQDLNNQLRDLKSALEVEEHKKNEEIKMRNVLEESYRERLNTIEELKAQVVELDRMKQSAGLRLTYFTIYFSISSPFCLSYFYCTWAYNS